MFGNRRIIAKMMIGSKYGSRNEVVAAILEAVGEEGAKKTE